MKPYVKYLALLAFLLAGLNLQAQLQFSIEVSAREMGRKDELKVDYVLSGSGDASNFRPPYFENWRVISGPDYSSEIYIINGIKTSVIRYSYMLAPGNTGKLGLPGASITAEGRQLQCAGTSVTVRAKDHLATAAAAAPQFQPGQAFEQGGEEGFREYFLKPGENPEEKIRRNLFIQSIPSKRKVYVGEPVLVSYKLYTRLKSNSRVVKQPTFGGCSVSEMTTSEVQTGTETLNGKKYRTYLFRKVQLFPLQPGLMTIGQASVDNSVEFLTQSGDLRKQYYDNQPGQVHQLTLSTTPYSIEVLPLPGKEKMAAIGEFQVYSKLKYDTIAANEPNALIVTIAGRGNFKTVAQPDISWPRNVYHFDAAETDEIDRTSFPLAGKRVYEIPFEASAPGMVDLPPVVFSYFDPNTARYRTVRSSPLLLTVTPAIKANIGAAVAAVEKSANIRFLYYLLPLVFALGAALIWRRSRQRPRVAVEPAVLPAETRIQAPASGIAERLDELCLLQDDHEFYSHARLLAREVLQQGGGNQELLVEVLEDCNTVLYTPIPSTSRKEVLDKLQRALG